MDADKQLEAVLGAFAAAMVGEGEDMVVDLAALEDGLAAAGINCTATTNRGALIAELSFLRDELRTQRIRRDHTDAVANTAKYVELQGLVEKMEAREQEIAGLLWPDR